MFDGIPNERWTAMTDQEKRWFNNVKKAFYASDEAFASGNPEDRSMEELCKAVDTAKTLRRSLRGEDTGPSQNKSRFVEFINLEVPGPDGGGLSIPLIDSRKNCAVNYSFAELTYAIRCMVHENENLNAAENPDYHITLDWAMDTGAMCFGHVIDDRLTCNAQLLWARLRQVMAKFITGVDTMIAVSEGRPFSLSIAPELCSIRPT